MVYDKGKDAIHLLGHSTLNESTFAIINSIDLNSKKAGGKGYFIQRGNMVLFKSPDGVVKRWSSSRKEFDDVDDSIELD